MPFLRVDAYEGRSKEQVKELLDAIHRAILSAFGVPLRDRYQVYQEHFESNFIVQDTGLGIDRTKSVVFIGNAYVERLIGTVRRECLDRMLVFGETHLRQILSAYAAYYNEVRTHLALDKDAPLGRAVQRSGAIVAIPILSGLHHHYVRI